MQYFVIYDGELYHHGIKGQKWGIRRFQNEDGTMTEQGLKRYHSRGRIRKALNKTEKKVGKASARAIKYTSNMDRAYTNSRKYNRLKKKAERNKDIQAEGKRQVDTLLKLAEQNGYTINSKTVLRYHNLGLPIVSQLLPIPLVNVSGQIGTMARSDREGLTYGASRYVSADKKYKIGKAKKE